MSGNIKDFSWRIIHSSLLNYSTLNVLLLASSRVLEPHLGDPFAESRHRSNPLQILAVGIAVNVEVGLQNLQLFLGEGRPDPLGFVVLL